MDHQSEISLATPIFPDMLTVLFRCLDLSQFQGNLLDFRCRGFRPPGLKCFGKETQS
jgi:hypothetical protein